MLLDDLRNALLRYAPSDEREATFRTRMLELADTANPFSRTSFHPGHFTASAFVLSKEHDRLLLVFHRKLVRWLQPGGHIELGDASVAAAAQREVEEETGVLGRKDALDGLFDIDVHEIPARPGEPAHEHFDLRVLLVASDDSVTASDEVEAVKWVKVADIGSLATDESVLRAVRKLRAAPWSRPPR